MVGWLLWSGESGFAFWWAEHHLHSRVNHRHSVFMCVIRFMQCERRCDEDPCCRGFGFIRDIKSMSNHGNIKEIQSHSNLYTDLFYPDSVCVCVSDVLCLSLISFGVQTCSEEDSTSWRTQDCSSSVQTRPEPLGWYQKPGTEHKITHYKLEITTMTDWVLCLQSISGVQLLHCVLSSLWLHLLTRVNTTVLQQYNHTGDIQVGRLWQ